MKARNIVTGKVYEVKLTTDHAASSYGQAVMVIAEGPEKGQAVDRVFYEIIGDKDLVSALNKELSLQDDLVSAMDKASDKDGGTA
ncbi:MAG: hypothetical protein BWX71_00736 [Deltaproteobacteria bacterium ADurb.Bin072]|nr:MAG: hypothetical protein BWX71_00736 [Deltaproteobacteria bacterium ADurb.Bin072]